MDSKKIQRDIWNHYYNNYYNISNAFVFYWESDFLTMTSSKYFIEIEIKISRSDFKNDFKKKLGSKGEYRYKHDLLVDKEFNFKPNKFFFAVPEGLIKQNEVPNNYGIIEISDDNYNSFKIIRNAKFLHKEKLLDNNIFIKSLLDKFYYRNANLRHLLALRDFDLKYGQKRLYEP
jgi:hypothetical protein